MSDPIRWRAPGSGASEEVRALLGEAARPQALDATARARNAAAVLKIAKGAAAPAAAVVGAKAAAKAGLGAKILVGLGLATAVTTTAVVGAHFGRPATRAQAPRIVVAPPRVAHVPPPASVRVDPITVPVVPASVRGPEPTASAPLVALRAPTQPTVVVAATGVRPAPSVVPAVPATTDLPTRVRLAPTGTAVVLSGVAGARGGSVASAPVVSGASVGGVAAPSSVEDEPSGDALAREQPLADAAFAAFRQGHPAEALQRADEHARAFPRGQFAAEREWVAVQSLRDLGRVAEARTRGEALITRFPMSPFAVRVRRLLDALP